MLHREGELHLRAHTQHTHVSNFNVTSGVTKTILIYTKFFHQSSEGLNQRIKREKKSQRCDESFHQHQSGHSCIRGQRARRLACPVSALCCACTQTGSAVGLSACTCTQTSLDVCLSQRGSMVLMCVCQTSLPVVITSLHTLWSSNERIRGGGGRAALTEGSRGVQFSGGQVGSGEIPALVVVVLHIQGAQFGEVDPQHAAAVEDVLTVQRLKDSRTQPPQGPPYSRRAPTHRPSPRLYAQACACFYACVCDSRPWRAEHARHH